ncbi:ATP-binding protein [Streptantibioticus rubrisoli]|uniref:Signal transduction histidine-protein kinase/phosphatase MprB n=1 Tax=Streptantibioticus rubrisoli TaxID=1387313 RepID=A0ABT1PCU3_9ACTN|nr:HAMP domain-containing sensor histidine kinase [Streptantibioticus rubrisoli]MCQ4043177.1 HAMP domain-containing histidine kinase [Streptantibioticus rubrisoli]
MRRPRIRWSVARGLRARLAVAFLLVAAVSALTTAALTFQEARKAILQRSQDTAINALRSQVNSLAPDLPFPPSASDLQHFAAQLDGGGQAQNWQAYASFQNGPLLPQRPANTSTAITPELRAAVTGKGVPVFQRVMKNGQPWLAIGMPVSYAGTGRAQSGLAVYAELPLTAEQANTGALIKAAERGAVPALALALVPALLAAQGVLRPVRRLRKAAGDIAAGRLDTRLDVRGGDELAELSRTFNHMAATLEENMIELRRLEATARRFASDVSHELRTPLAAMTAVTDVLDEDAATLDPDTAAAVRLVSEETAKLARMVEDLMEVSRFDAGAAALHLDEVDAAETVRKSLQARGWQDQVEAQLPGGVRAVLDPRRIDVVVANLVGNALRHGGAPVRIRLATRAGRLLIEVADNGPGIPDEVLPHIFERFYKADAARARSEGSGLGLAIAEENVRLHGGELRAANRPEGGAVFTVDLPLRAQGGEEQ